MSDILKVIMSSIAMVAAVYVVLKYSSNLSTEAGGFTSSYAKVAKSWQGG